jgi:hypothetical protein
MILFIMSYTFFFENLLKCYKIGCGIGCTAACLRTDIINSNINKQKKNQSEKTFFYELRTNPFTNAGLKSEEGGKTSIFRAPKPKIITL